MATREQAARAAQELVVELELVRAERDKEAAGRRAAVADAQRLQEELVRVSARLEVLETAAAAGFAAAAPRPRGLASLFAPHRPDPAAPDACDGEQSTAPAAQAG
ncbi:MAG: hypothetical protein NVSMB55_28750 [Mycobacteriales bacterium]